jgi:L-asparaginase II
VRELVARATALDDLPEATDGCGVPTFAAPISAMARAFARLARGELPGAERVTAVMRAQPQLVGGPKAADTQLMQKAPDTVVKRGAEGLLCAALPDGTGLCVKVEDGANRAAGPALAAVLGIESLEEQEVFNSRGEQVGRVIHSWKKEGSLFPRPL